MFKEREQTGKRSTVLKKPWVETAALILLPVLSLLIAAAILLPELRFLWAHVHEPEMPEPEPTVSEAVLLPPAPTPTELPDEHLGNWHVLDGKTYYLDENGIPATGLHRIDGKLVFFRPDGSKASSLGVDASYYNEHVDWKSVKEQGIDFAIIRAGARGWSKGALYGDVRTLEYLRNAQDAGLKVGIYFYSTAVNSAEAVEEAHAVLKTLKGFTLDYPIYIDMEYSGEYPEGRADQLSREKRVEIACAFCSTITSEGYQAGVYASQNFLKYATVYDAISQYSIWLASYTVDAKLPNFDRDYDIWQFTDSGLVRGMPGPIDLNVIF